MRLEEINRKLRMNDFIPPEKERYAHMICFHYDHAKNPIILPGRLPRLPLMTPTVVVLTPARYDTAKSLKTSASGSSIAP